MQGRRLHVAARRTCTLGSAHTTDPTLSLDHIFCFLFKLIPHSRHDRLRRAPNTPLFDYLLVLTTKYIPYALSSLSAPFYVSLHLPYYLVSYSHFRSLVSLATQVFNCLQHSHNVLSPLLPLAVMTISLHSKKSSGSRRTHPLVLRKNPLCAYGQQNRLNPS